MIKCGGTIKELGFTGMDCQLNFAIDFVVKSYVDENVISTELKSVFNSDNPHLVWLAVAYPLNFVKDFQNLILLRGALAPHQVSDSEAH